MLKSHFIISLKIDFCIRRNDVVPRVGRGIQKSIMIRDRY